MRTNLISRRSFLKGGLLLSAIAIAPALTACSQGGKTTQGESQSRSTEGRSENTVQETQTQGNGSDAGKTLLVFFSRAGENYTSSGIAPTEIGNTAVMADIIQQELGCDVYEIKAADPYPYSYEETLDRAQAEIDDDARPAIEGALPDLSQYDTILVGSGIWWGRPPMIMSTFLESVDTAGKTIVPFTTHGGSGLGPAPSVYEALCPDAMFGKGLAVSGERAADCREDVVKWLQELGLLAE